MRLSGDRGGHPAPPRRGRAPVRPYNGLFGSRRNLATGGQSMVDTGRHPVSAVRSRSRNQPLPAFVHREHTSDLRRRDPGGVARRRPGRARVHGSGAIRVRERGWILSGRGAADDCTAGGPARREAGEVFDDAFHRQFRPEAVTRRLRAALEALLAEINRRNAGDASPERLEAIRNAATALHAEMRRLPDGFSLPSPLREDVP